MRSTHAGMRIAAPMIVWSLGLIASSAHAMDLVTQGVPNAVIVVADEAPPSVSFAAQELNRYIERMTGTPLEVMTVSAQARERLASVTAGRAAVLVGESAYTRTYGVPRQPLASEGFEIRTLDNVLSIVGHDDRGFDLNYDRNPSSAGTLYGVYRFLEELGCRWYYANPEYHVVPTFDTLTIDDMDIVDAPYFEYRFTYGQYEWRRRLGFGGTVDPWSTRHTFTQTIRPEQRYGESHPEAFVNGFHFPHPGVMDVVVKAARSFMQGRRPTGKNYFLVIPSDHYEGHDCAACHEARTPERGPLGEFSDLVGRAVVETAKQVADLPGKIVYCAYEKYRLPPRDIERLPRNVVVLLALSRVPFNNPDTRAAGWDLIDQWQSVAPARLYFCRYYNSFLKLTPSYAPRMIARDIQRMKAYNEEGQLSIGGEMNFGSVSPEHPYAWWFNINEYVTAKMLWNPDQDIDVLLQDYYDRFYGVAAEPMGRFFDRLEELYHTPQQLHLYSLPVIEELEGYLQEAQKLADGTRWAKHVAYIDQGFDPVRAIRQKLAQNDTVEERSAPVASFPFDEQRGERTRDVARDVHAHISGATWTRGVRGSALRFDGENSYVSFPRLNLKETDYSFELWMMPEEITFGRSQYLIGPHSWEQVAFRLSNGALTLLHRHQAPHYSASLVRLIARSAELKPRHWYHVVGTFSQQHGMAMYINGVLVAMDPTLNRSSDFGVHFIGAGGRRGPEQMIDHFKGVIDEVKIYRRELTLGEVQNKFERSKPESGLDDEFN